jgi:hypothetical protein
MGLCGVTAGPRGDEIRLEQDGVARGDKFLQSSEELELFLYCFGNLLWVVVSASG